MEDMKIIMVPVADLLPYEGNARKHTDKDVGKIVEAIKVDGFDDPIGIWGERNLIVEGHGRLLAAKKLGMKEVPCIRLDDMTEDQRKEYAIRHNRSAEMSTWDFQMLEEEIIALEAIGVDLGSLDFQFDQKWDDDEVIEGGVAEFGEEDFGDEKFQCTCPACGFRFNET